MVDDHSFFFRERHGEWRIELDLRSSGHFVKALIGTGVAGEARYDLTWLTFPGFLTVSCLTCWFGCRVAGICALILGS
ncbi:hypothetical protein [Mycobacterium sp.]|uniref:hypothetical protein n=1 Tax=Mycobacterium sp. TaxID=1785 RepID=UPI002604CE42|nr:hypothetical protein [Mycobacterium sp.]